MNRYVIAMLLVAQSLFLSVHPNAADQIPTHERAADRRSPGSRSAADLNAVLAGVFEWAPVALFEGREVPDLFVDGDTLYVAAIANVYRHPAGTGDWIGSAEIGAGIEISRVFKTRGRLFAGTFQHGVYESDDGGATWSELTDFATTPPWDMTSAPDGSVWLVADGTIYRYDSR